MDWKYVFWFTIFEKEDIESLNEFAKLVGAEIGLIDGVTTHIIVFTEEMHKRKSEAIQIAKAFKTRPKLMSWDWFHKLLETGILEDESKYEIPYPP